MSGHAALGFQSLRKHKVHRYGWRREIPDAIQDKWLRIATPSSLPAQTNVFSAHNPPVLDQGQLGSCTAHGIGTAFQFERMRQGLAPNFTPSRLFIYYGERVIEHTVNEDAGAEIRDGIKVVAKLGAPPESDWPYNIDKFADKPPMQAYKDALNNQCLSYFRVSQNLQIMKSCLVAGFPIIIGFTVYESFESAQVAQDGKVPMPGPNEQSIGGHCVIVYGHDDTAGVFKLRNSWGCYDDQTEILTNVGWQKFSDLDDDSVVATLNPSFQELEYQRVQARHTYDYSGDLLHFDSQGIDLLVTPNHNMYVGSKNKGPKAEWGLERADSLRSPFLRMKKDAGWTGKDIPTYTVGAFAIEMDLWLEFLGYWISEGHCNSRQHHRPARSRIRRTGSGEEYTAQESARLQHDWVVGVSQSKDEGVLVIGDCLARMPFSFCRYGNGWTTNSRALFAELDALGDQPNRRLPDYIRTLSRRQSRILFDAMMVGDGTRGAQTSYYTSSPCLADDVQELALRCGYAADIYCIDRIGRPVAKNTGRAGVTRHKEYQVSIKSVKTEPCPDKGFVPARTPYQGKVYCVTVPNHIIYVRRNGQAAWCGNSEWGDNGNFTMPYQYLTNANLASDFWTIRLVEESA
jgi:hypothetical protein